MPKLSADVDYYSWSSSARVELMKKNLLWTITKPVPQEPTLSSLREWNLEAGFTGPEAVVTPQQLREVINRNSAKLAEARNTLLNLVNPGIRPTSDHLETNRDMGQTESRRPQ